MGYRPGGGVAGVFAAIILAIIAGWSLAWVFTWFGTVGKSAQVVQGYSLMVMFPLTFLSNAFVPADTLPGLAADLRQDQPGLPRRLRGALAGQRRHLHLRGRLVVPRLRRRDRDLRPPVGAQLQEEDLRLQVSPVDRGFMQMRAKYCPSSAGFPGRPGKPTVQPSDPHGLLHLDEEVRQPPRPAHGPVARRTPPGARRAGRAVRVRRPRPAAPSHHREGPVVGEPLGHHQQAYGRLRIELRIPLARSSSQAASAATIIPVTGKSRKASWPRSSRWPLPRTLSASCSRARDLGRGRREPHVGDQRRGLGDDRPGLHPGGLHAREADGAHLRRPPRGTPPARPRTSPLARASSARVADSIVCPPKVGPCRIRWTSSRIRSHSPTSPRISAPIAIPARSWTASSLACSRSSIGQPSSACLRAVAGRPPASPAAPAGCAACPAATAWSARRPGARARSV